MCYRLEYVYSAPCQQTSTFTKGQMHPVWLTSPKEMVTGKTRRIAPVSKAREVSGMRARQLTLHLTAHFPLKAPVVVVLFFFVVVLFLFFVFFVFFTAQAKLLLADTDTDPATNHENHYGDSKEYSHHSQSNCVNSSWNGWTIYQ